jgi:hypothetical protein
MTNKQLRKYAKTAVDAIGLQAKKYAIDANLYKMGLCDTPNAENSYNKYVELNEAMQFFDDIANGKTGLPMFDQ